MENINKINSLLFEMKNNLDKIRYKHPNPNDLDRFLEIYKRFLETNNCQMEWEKIGPPNGKLFNYSELNKCGKKLMSKLAVLKLNGGLGTTMGCEKPKGIIKVRGKSNFLDMTIKQLEYLGNEYDCTLPLILMNSFATESQTKEIISNYSNIRMFNQSAFPRISSNSYKLLNASDNLSSNDLWYPPGHGDMFYSLKQSGMLDQLLNEGKEYLFVSNIDNLAATVDPKILGFLSDGKMDFVMEVTTRTRADVKGGTLVDYSGELRLLEIAQVPDNKRAEFRSIKKFPIFNTNSVWLNLRALKEMDDKIKLDLIKNKKIVNGEEIIQIETAIGSAVRYFERNCGVIVPRSRFAPVKTCSDLLLIDSNLYIEKNGYLNVNKLRIFNQLPVIRLIGSTFQTVKDFENAFSYIPNIIDLESLTIVGNVIFKKNIILKGTIIIIAINNDVINIQEGTILEDKLIYDSQSIDL